MVPVLEAENKCFPLAAKHFRKGRKASSLNSSVMIAAESKKESSKSLKLYTNEENINLAG